MKGIKRMIKVLTHTGAIHIFWAFLFIIGLAAAVVTIVEPSIQSYADGLWYCFIASTTVGFGDLYAVTAIGRIVTVLVTVFGIMTVAMVPGVVVAYYTEYLKAREEETISRFLEKLENLPNLSQEELQSISDKIKKIK